MLAIAGLTARPNWLTFLEQPKVTSAKKLNFFSKNEFFFECQFFKIKF